MYKCACVYFQIRFGRAVNSAAAAVITPDDARVRILDPHGQ